MNSWTQQPALYSPAMRTISLLVLLTVFTAALLIATASLGIGAQSLPKASQFSVDPNWPQIPNNWVLGEVTSISVGPRRSHLGVACAAVDSRSAARQRGSTRARV